MSGKQPQQLLQSVAKDLPIAVGALDGDRRFRQLQHAQVEGSGHLGEDVPDVGPRRQLVVLVSPALTQSPPPHWLTSRHHFRLLVPQQLGRQRPDVLFDRSQDTLPPIAQAASAEAGRANKQDPGNGVGAGV